MRISILAAVLFPVAVFPAWAAENTKNSPVNFYSDVAPILQRRCQDCHRPGEIGPMPLLTYQQARPWAKAMKAAVIQRKMPPWDADPRFGSFQNERSLSQSELQTIVAWVDGGAPEGNSALAPTPRKFVDGWRIGKPDLIFEMPREFHIPAAGTVPYQWIKMPTGFTEDKWVEAIEVRPGYRAVVHHGVAYAREPDSDYAKDAPYGEFFENPLSSNGNVTPNGEILMFSTTKQPEHLQVFAPGADPIQLRPGQARLIRAGADIIFEMHYTPNGQAGVDRTRLGLIFAKQTPKERVRTIRINNGARIAIPPGDPNYRMEARVQTLEPMKIVSFMPHMHLRGKSMEFRVLYPDGTSELLLSVPRYQFHWQTTYYLTSPKVLPKGAVLVCAAVFDNSANNPNNPDPTVLVKGGVQSWDEMMNGFVDFALAPSQSLDLLRNAPLPALGAGQ